MQYLVATVMTQIVVAADMTGILLYSWLYVTAFELAVVYAERCKKMNNGPLAELNSVSSRGA